MDVQAVQLNSRERLLTFCRSIQKRCPVGAYIRPVAGATSGYGDEVCKSVISWFYDMVGDQLGSDFDRMIDVNIYISKVADTRDRLDMTSS